ncbi:MAG TPA: nuclear transport factor 2 family protein [Methylomirabilota bacterium]|jgi:ketosteroid isomerase-like protein|nr:nuclear transport factor 2 family protein [Methylomirabilota bacterium]
MTRVAVLLLSGGALLAAGSARAQEPKTPTQLREEAALAEEHRQELTTLEREAARALQVGNLTFYRRVYGEDFVSISANGQVMDHAAFIAALENSPNKYTSVLATDIRVRIFENTAIITCLWSFRGSNAGHPFSRQSRMTHVYVYGQSGWKVVAAQETVLPG